MTEMSVDDGHYVTVKEEQPRVAAFEEELFNDQDGFRHKSLDKVTLCFSKGNSFSTMKSHLNVTFSLKALTHQTDVNELVSTVASSHATFVWAKNLHLTTLQRRQPKANLPHMFFACMRGNITPNQQVVVGCICH